MNLQCGDCLSLMKDIPDKSIDMILCDLPYGVTNNKSDIVIPFEPLWNQYERIVKDNGAICLFAQGIFYVDLVNSNRKYFRYDLIWDKQLVTGFLNAKRMPMRRHEQICVFYKKPPVYHPQFTEGKPQHSAGTKEKGSQVVNRNYGSYGYAGNERAGNTLKYPTSILSFQKPHPSIAKHRTEKPIDLLEYLIRTYTNENDTVLDNCMGAGGTGVACVHTGRNFIGMEINEIYFTIAKERIEDSICLQKQRELC